MPFALSVLDQSPVVTGATPRDAVFATIALARAAEGAGYTRYWLAEHHAMHGLADAAPEILLARLGAETSRIRIGTGGVLLPHYSAFKVAEQFRMLEALTPGRVDLGVGRAPGGVPRVNAALSSRDVDRFPEQVQDLIDHLDRTMAPGHPFASLPAMPTGHTSPDVYILGSSGYGGSLAAHLGLPYAFAHFIGGDGATITDMYRERFRPSRRAAKPYVILTVSAITAPTGAEADQLSRSIDLWRLRNRSGENLTVPSTVEALSYAYSPYELAQVEHNRRRLIAGAPGEVRERLEALAREHQADEIMIVTIAPTYEARLRSYELLAAAFELAPGARAAG